MRFDPELALVAAKHNILLILMHMLGNPKIMQVSPEYQDLVGEIREFLEDAVNRAEAQGVARANIILDPGIGFGKTVRHNLLLIKHLEAFAAADFPILIGPSRKSFIRKILKDEQAEDISPDLAIVETGTQAAVAAAVLNGAHIVRVHDVANTFATVKIIDAVMNAQKDSSD